MSMKWLTILQFLEIVAAYGIVTLFLPWLILRKRFRRFSVAEQITGYFFAGNFYIIYLAYLLQFLHISNRVTLILGTVGPFLGVWIWKRRSKIPGAVESLLILIERLLSGERGKKTSLVQLRRTIYERCFRGRRKQWLNVLLELAVLGFARLRMCTGRIWWRRTATRRVIFRYTTTGSTNLIGTISGLRACIRMDSTLYCIIFIWCLELRRMCCCGFSAWCRRTLYIWHWLWH